MTHIEVQNITEHEDGSATFTIDMDYDSLMHFAKKGILAALIEAAGVIISDEEKVKDNEG